MGAHKLLIGPQNFQSENLWKFGWRLAQRNGIRGTVALWPHEYHKFFAVVSLRTKTNGIIVLCCASFIRGCCVHGRLEEIHKLRCFFCTPTAVCLCVRELSPFAFFVHVLFMRHYFFFRSSPQSVSAIRVQVNENRTGGESEANTANDSNARWKYRSAVNERGARVRSRVKHNRDGRAPSTHTPYTCSSSEYLGIVRAKSIEMDMVRSTAILIWILFLSPVRIYYLECVSVEQVKEKNHRKRNSESKISAIFLLCRAFSSSPLIVSLFSYFAFYAYKFFVFCDRRARARASYRIHKMIDVKSNVFVPILD